MRTRTFRTFQRRSDPLMTVFCDTGTPMGLGGARPGNDDLYRAIVDSRITDSWDRRAPGLGTAVPNDFVGAVKAHLQAEGWEESA